MRAMVLPGAWHPLRRRAGVLGLQFGFRSGPLSKVTVWVWVLRFVQTTWSFGTTSI